MLLPPTGSSPNPPPPVDEDWLAITGCVVCGEEVPDGTVCSRDCAIEAERQVAGNIVELRQLGGDDDHSRARRRVITARNGRLTDAMLSWRPEDT